jgi:uncharacterized phage protein (TIGR02220 family)
MSGWIKLHRTIQNSKFGKNPELFHLFAVILLRANHKDGFTKDGTLIKAGQFMTSQIGLANEFKYKEMKMHRMLSRLKSEGQIDVSATSKNTIITVTNWEYYQQGDGVIDEQVRNKQGSDEEQVRTNKNANNNKNENNSKPEAMVIAHYNLVNKRNLKQGDSNYKEIKARLKEGYSIDEMKELVEYAAKVWSKDPFWTDKNRPSTLFNSKFDGYLQNAKDALKPKIDPLMALAQKHLGDSVFSDSKEEN